MGSTQINVTLVLCMYMIDLVPCFCFGVYIKNLCCSKGRGHTLRVTPFIYEILLVYIYFVIIYIPLPTARTCLLWWLTLVWHVCSEMREIRRTVAHLTTPNGKGEMDVV